ncbi:hypothetical protein F0562_013320 [Nyssa sinensis]|uniref:Uncharacterized protein n=1 Tax=Nyssa sinensis TaxID=561372 RepID=A0A5J4ZW78_9ASTE|nr:hypothetical protein F0562_013320 [Nyssa sinensis]
MENKRCQLLPNIAFVFAFALICTFDLYSAIALEAEISSDGLIDMEIGSLKTDAKVQKSLETYIVHVNHPDGGVFSQSDDIKSWYHSFLPASTASSSDASSRMIYTYQNVISGFAARLSPEEAKIMEKKKGFVSARPQRVFPLHTTHSPNFLGLHQNLGFWRGSNYGKGVIVGILDTGITPNHPSFSDEGVPPPPAKWKGKCEFNGTACNNKLIGARNFVSGETEPAPLDEEGHGTHTSSTAAGNFVEDANLFGQANGTAAGMAPLAHLAMYKVCSGGCYESDILAAMDAAVEDGVDVLSLSLGAPSLPFYDDGIAVGAFGAIQKGVFVSCSAGNSGPYNASLSNEAPWILTVGASTIDRSIRATALLGNKDEIDGESIFQPHDFPPTLLPLVYPGANDEDAALCGPGSLNNTDVKGKVVLCVRGGGIARIEKGQTVKDAGGAAMILMNEQPDGYSTLADAHVLPATHVGYQDGELIKAYINSTSSPTATILFRGTVIGVDYAPMVSSFSSRGPSWESPGILKPDIIGPGVSILAAWPVSLDNTTVTKSPFNMISGTSMSCPHLGGIAALLKSVHPDWSPAAIKSAIMTSADLLNLDGNPILDERFLPADIFATGAGHVNPSKASDPGLVYDIKPDDYIPYLCGLGYTDREIAIIVQQKVKCAEVSSIPEAQLNYPTFSIAIGSIEKAYTRTVTNVGEAASSYTVYVDLPGFDVTVEPSTLVFSELAKASELPSAVEKTEKGTLRTYIVHVKQPEGRVSTQSEELKNYHQSFLPIGMTASDNRQRLIYSYQHVISGFAARLTEEEVEAIKKKDGFVSASPERMLRLQTTHTPHFLGLHQEMGVWKESNFGKGVIVGMLDSGVFPNHPSFSGEGMPPPPAKWKGKCEFNASQCNNKLIGARSFNIAAQANKGGQGEPPLDDDGHGTHTASTAAGGFVKNADALGNAKGTAVGMAPQAHLAIYKVCFGPDCPETDILAGLDAAVHDGVDVISISLGTDIPMPFYQDNIAIGSLAAIQKGIFVSCAAGNSGPFNTTLSNEAPWILTVGASTIDRSIRATAKLGNGEQFDGESLFQPGDFPPKLLPLIYAGSNGKPESALCGQGSLKGIDVKGKVVLCERGGGIARIAKGGEVKNAGGAAMILMNPESDGFSTESDAHVLPATHVSNAAGLKIKAYVSSTTTPMATILFKGTVIGDPLAPVVTSFSSRGPNSQSPGILKPDIIGPGVNILAAWPFPLDNNTNSESTFNVISGTSMSCPHLSGIAALLKSSHPYWSPAAIKSAIMTSADLLNDQGKPILDQTLHPADIFATGAGHVNPQKANDPGLVYDIQPDDYIPYLCGLGYTDEQIRILAHRPIKCSEESSIAEGQLNYPTFSVALGPSQTFTRTVTNVGGAYSSYSVMVVAPQGVVVSVKPDKIYFSKVNQKVTYSVTFSRNSEKNIGEFTQGFLEWVSAKHRVRSVISVKFQ